MKDVKSLLALLCVLTLAAPQTWAQQPTINDEGGPWHSRFTRKYTPGYVAPIDVSNSSRADQLIQQGNLYLSLNDAIAMALENNVDVEVSRYTFEINQQALNAAEAGSGGVNFDPVLTSNLNFNRGANIQTNAVTAGGQSVNVNKNRQMNFGIQQGLKTGGTLTMGFNNSRNSVNNANNFFNPTYTSGLQLQANQPLLNGFGLALNTRGIRIAKNNLRLTDYQFQQQVNTTLNQVIQAYWNLVSATLQVDVTRQTLEISQRQLEDNQKQVDIGTMAPMEVVSARAQVATNRSNLVNAQGQVRIQETNLKNLLSRNGIASPVLGPVHIVPTDRITVPEVEPVQPLQDLTELAISKRPELMQQQIQMENTRENLRATRNSMLPTVTVTGNISNPGTGGPVNPIENVNPITGEIIPRDLNRINPDYIGGYTNVLRQLFGVPTLTYGVGFQINIPLRNRTAQAQMNQQTLQLRQTELQYQRQINQIRADVQNAQIAIDQARERYLAAQEASALQQQTLDNEQKKLQLGASTVFQVIQTQQNLANARQQEVTAQVAYANAKLQMDVATGNLMEKYNIVFDEARDGRISRRADPIPVVLQNQGAAVRPAAPATTPR